ncbi:MAG: DUF1345 domain-containing protein [Acidiferrobacteraceae bacterium]
MRFGAPRRLVAALVAATAAFLLQPHTLSLHTRLLISWDVGTLVYLGLAWALIVAADARMTRDHVLDQDQSSVIIFLLVVIAACAAIVAIGFLVSTLKGLPFWPKAGHLTLSIVALISSWMLIQTVFAFHYARHYYAVSRHTTPGTEGLAFPGQHPPDYLDFAYYSLVVGMTSQVSDVVITARRMRHITMTHAVLAFIFNIAILALSINIIASAV